MEVECNLSMRRYQVLITTDKGEFPKFSKALGRYYWPIGDEVAGSLPSVGGQGTHNIPPGAKGKTKLMGPVIPASLVWVSEVKLGSPDRVDSTI